VLIADSIAKGTLMTKESAKNIIEAAFPSFTDEQINGIVDSLEVKIVEPTNQ